VHARLDARLGERVTNRVPVGALGKHRDGEVVGRRVPIVTLGERDRQAELAVETSRVSVGELPPCGIPCRKSTELDESHCRADVVESVVVAREENVVRARVAPMTVPGERRHPVRPEQPHAPREVVVVGDDHPALADWQVFVREEAEAAERAQRSAGLAAHGRADGVGCVLDDDDSARCGDLQDRIDRTREAAVVQGHDCLRSRCDRRFDVGGIEVEVVRPEDVAEDWSRPHMPNRVRDGDERQRRGDHLVSGADLRREQGEVKRTRSVADRDRMARLDEACEVGLELGNAWSGAPPPGANGVRYRACELLVAADIGERHLPFGCTHGSCHSNRISRRRANGIEQARRSASGS
jgi:hypothetical protein